MRLAIPSYNPVKECNSCTLREENQVSAHILSYQIAHQLLKNYAGTMVIDGQTLRVTLASLDEPLMISLHNGTLHYKSLNIPLQQHYASGKRMAEIMAEVINNLALPEGNPNSDQELYGLLTKLIEIYHARCGLQIITLDQSEGRTTWELRLCEQGPAGWITSDGMARNRFGEVLNLQEWKHLRPEKLAAYVFGFNRYCSHFPSPLKESATSE